MGGFEILVQVAEENAQAAEEQERAERDEVTSDPAGLGVREDGVPVSMWRGLH